MTIARREFLLGGLMVGMLGTAEVLRPRKSINLMGDRELDTIVPQTVGPWHSVADARLVQPVSEGSLVDTLYDGLLTRRYVNGQDGSEIMLLIAYGSDQTDSLQLHRPEACYPAVGIPIVARTETAVEFDGRAIPAVELIGQSPSRTEDIVYWTRMGNSFPQSASDQRTEKLKLALRGYIPDGILVRASAIRQGDTPDFAIIHRFVTDLLGAVKPADRPALIGTAA